MPELPEVETVCRGLATRLVGRRLVRVEVRRTGLRVPFPSDLALRLTGRLITAIERRAKYILVRFEDGTVMIAHLGMSGRMVITLSPTALPGKHDHLLLTTDDDARVSFNDPRRFGLVALTTTTELARHPLLIGLGPEPLRPDFTSETFAARLTGKRTPIKSALLDQTVVAGLGNIYVSEALFQAGLLPTRPAASLTGTETQRLVMAIQSVLTAAIAAGGSSLKDYVQVSGELGTFQHRFAVYDRAGQPCPGCTCDVTATGGIVREVHSGRASYFCPRHQG